MSKSPKVTYVFYNPNPPEVMDEFLSDWYADTLVKIKEGKIKPKYEDKIKYKDIHKLIEMK